MLPPDKQVEKAIVIACQQRGEKKTVCPSEIARNLSSTQWRSVMPKIRVIADGLVDRGILIAKQKGQCVDILAATGPIRLTIHEDKRDTTTPCLELLNLGPASCDDLHRTGIETLGDLRQVGACEAFETVMIQRLHRGVRQHSFHAMYLYALWGALQNLNCVKLPAAVRDGLLRKSRQIRDDCIGPT
ncbi:MAG: DUF3253 domain-containing protein [Planctomycetota bacterium]